MSLILKGSYLKPLLATVALAAADAGSAAAAQDGEIVLRVDGTPGAAFSADCELKTTGGNSAFSLDEAMPFEATYVGTGLVCRIRADGPIEAEAAMGGSRSRSSTSGGSVRVNIGS
jgi:hypothetical protein